MKLKKLSMVLLIVGIVALTADVAYAQFEVYLTINGVSGKSRVDSRSTDWTQILGMPHPSRFASGAAGGGGAQTGKVEISDFSIDKYVDKASPKISEICSSGSHVRDVTLELRRAGGDKQAFLKIKMTDVKITGIKPVRGKSNLERVTFQYKILKWERLTPIKKAAKIKRK